MNINHLTQWEYECIFFYGYVKSKATLKQFVGQYNITLKNEVQKEVEEDARCLSPQLPVVKFYRCVHHLKVLRILTRVDWKDVFQICQFYRKWIYS